VIVNMFRGAALVFALIALTLSLSTYLDNRGHPWLNERITLLFGGCPHSYVSSSLEDGYGRVINETCEAP
jgi:hypothetical protein